MPKLKINDTEIEVEPGTSILQAAEQLGVEIPRFCYHDRLSVPANCRMCLVELEGAPKPVASCAMAAGEGMVVYTDSEKTKKARKGVMEMLLINHPLDCPICDQGGECDLQDQAMAYGFDRSRYYENKRAVKDKDLGPLIKTVMTRCINCTRCVRFGEEVAGVTELGQLNRGEDAEIGTFIESAVTTELSGNMIDICPVGALTSKPYAFNARPWELKKTETIDVMDGVGSNIRVDARGREVLRVFPRLHEDVNEEWISDRTRFSYDGLGKNRLDQPYVRDETTRKLRPASWDEALSVISDKMKTYSGDQMAAFAGDLCDAESMLALKDLMGAFGSENLECRVNGEQFDETQSSGYLFNSSIAGIDEADAILLVGTNPRFEATMINARIRKAWVERRIPISYIGPETDLSYPAVHLGDSPKDLEKLIKSKGAKVQSEKPMIIAGMGAFMREDGMHMHGLLRNAAEKLGCIKEDWNGFNIIHTAASRVAALELGFVPHKPFEYDEMSFVYLLGVDNPHVIQKLNPASFVVYQGHHGDAGAQRADVILPGAAYTEKNGLYMNTEGRVQRARKAVDAPGEAREDWKILRALSALVGKTLRYDDLAQLRERLVNEYPQFDLIDELPVHEWAEFGLNGKVSGDDFVYPVDNFYITNVITKASDTMRQCVERFYNDDNFAEAAE
ncbi:MAG: NADH-quinone oxidoreductase subunit NuoG [Pseudomonadota bacterium]